MSIRAVAVGAAVVAGIVAVLALIAGPLTWWLTPAEAAQLPAVDRLRVENDTRTTLVWAAPMVLLPAALALARLSATRTLQRRARAVTSAR